MILIEGNHYLHKSGENFRIYNIRVKLPHSNQLLHLDSKQFSEIMPSNLEC